MACGQNAERFDVEARVRPIQQKMYFKGVACHGRTRSAAARM